MATGDQNDNVQRQRAVIPPWFPDADNAPVLTSILKGTGSVFAFVYDFLTEAAKQTRIRTATGGWLDMIAWDFFAARFVRRNEETDSSWQPRIIKEILRPRQTKAALSQMLVDLTGNVPVIQEAFSPSDFGSYGTGTMAYGAGLGYGSLLYSNAVFITAFRPASNGVPFIAGYNAYGGGYGVGWLSYIDMSLVTGPVTDEEIYARIQETIAAGITAWVAIQNGPTVQSGGMLDFSNPDNSQYIPVI